MPFTIKKEAPKQVVVTMGQADKEIEDGDKLREQPGALPPTTGNDGARTEEPAVHDRGDGDQEGTGQQEGANRSERDTQDSQDGR